MVPTCIDDDRAAAAAVNRRTLTCYVKLPNYQNYWIEAGYAEEMQAIRAAIARKDDDKIPSLMSDRWLRDVTLFGAASRGARGRGGLASDRRHAPSSSCRRQREGGQMKAFEELIAAYR